MPAGIVSFNVFVSLSAEADLALQNSSPVAVASSFTVTAGLVAGRTPGNGQDPDVWVTSALVLNRG